MMTIINGHYDDCDDDDSNDHYMMILRPGPALELAELQVVLFAASEQKEMIPIIMYSEQRKPSLQLKSL